MNQVYAPGCALLIYKPHLAEQIQKFFNTQTEMPAHTICCRHEPMLTIGTQIINTCPGCDRRFRELYEGVSTVSLWEMLADSDVFEFPNYQGSKMTIHDACPARSEERIHNAIRKLLNRMNIDIVEPPNTRSRSVCCGDSFYGQLPVDAVKSQMKKRADEMPCEEVVVYCVSCVKAMHIGGKKPRYIVDLLFAEQTEIGIFEPDLWHNELQNFIDAH